jgi:hypothetical protein
MNRCNAINENMVAYRDMYHILDDLFNGCEVSHISRASNDEAGALAKIGPQCLPIPPRVVWEEIKVRSTKEKKPEEKSKSKKGKASKHKLDSGVSVAPDKEDEEVEDEETEEVLMVEVAWMQPYLAYMMNKQLPENQVEARRIA